MLDSGKLVGFVMTSDYAAARAFYEGKLGLQFVAQDEFALVVRSGGHMIRVVKVPEFAPAQGTVLGWEVEDVGAVVRWLKGRGIETEKYGLVPDKEWGIWEAPGGDKVAWFKDPDGNVLSVSEHV